MKVSRVRTLFLLLINLHDALMRRSMGISSLMRVCILMVEFPGMQISSSVVPSNTTSTSSVPGP